MTLPEPDDRPWCDFAIGHVICQWPGCGEKLRVMVQALPYMTADDFPLRPRMDDAYAHIWACPYNPDNAPVKEADHAG